MTELDNVVLYNIDDLKNVVEENKEMRAQDAQAALKIIEEDVDAIRERLRYLSMRPVMVRLHDKFDFIRNHLVQKAFRKMPDLTKDQQKKIELLSEKMLYKFLRNPMINMVHVAGTDEEDKYRESINQMFLLNLKEEDEYGDETVYHYWD